MQEGGGSGGKRNKSRYTVTGRGGSGGYAAASYTMRKPDKGSKKTRHKVVDGPSGSYYGAAKYHYEDGPAPKSTSSSGSSNKKSTRRKVVDGPSGSYYGAAKYHYEDGGMRGKLNVSGRGKSTKKTPKYPSKYGAWGYSSANLAKKGERTKAAARKIEDRRNEIGRRVRTGEYKGKYYGHDEFKGDLNALYKWKRAGKPNIAKFIKKHGIKPTRSWEDK